MKFYDGSAYGGPEDLRVTAGKTTFKIENISGGSGKQINLFLSLKKNYSTPKPQNPINMENLGNYF